MPVNYIKGNDGGSLNRVDNILPFTLRRLNSGWAENKVNGGAITISADKLSAQITTDGTAGGRAYLYFALNTTSMVAGNTYALMCKVTVNSGTPSDNVVYHTQARSPGDFGVTPDESGIWVVRFTPTGTINGQCRIGLGCSGAENNAVDITVERACIYEIASITTVPYEPTPPASTNAGFAYTHANTMTLRSDKLELVQGTAVDIPSNKVGMVICDSYGDQGFSFPEEMADVIPDSSIYVDTLSGRKASDITSTIGDILDDNVSDLSASLPPAQWVFCNLGYNDIQTGRTTENLTDDIATIKAACVARGLKFFTATVAPGNDITGGEITEKDDYNLLVRASGDPYLEGTIIKDPTDADAVEPNFTGDAIHPNTDIGAQTYGLAAGQTINNYYQTSSGSGGGGGFSGGFVKSFIE